MAFTNETDVANFYSRTGLPESVAVSGILEHKLFTKDIVLHQWIQRASEVDKRRDMTTPALIAHFSGASQQGVSM